MAATMAVAAQAAQSEALREARAEIQAQKRRCRRLRVERRRLADALRQQEALSEQLRDLDSVRSGLLLAVSHDLRGPMTALTGLARILAAEAGHSAPERLAAVVEALRGNAARVEFVQANLIDLDRLASRAVAISRRPTPLADLVDAGVVAADLREHAVVAHASGAANIDPVFAGRILDNLLNNASQHAPAGTLIEVRAVARDDGALLSVVDHGPGIEPAMRVAVFEAFVTGGARSGSSSRQAGMGIGLHIVLRFAAAHGGAAWIEETPGGGATVNVLLADAA